MPDVMHLRDGEMEGHRIKRCLNPVARPFGVGDCHRCGECRKRRNRELVLGMMAETLMASKTVAFTFTLGGARHGWNASVLQMSRRAERAMKNALQRVRDRCKAYDRERDDGVQTSVRYFWVPEKGTKKDRLHFHGMLWFSGIPPELPMLDRSRREWNETERRETLGNERVYGHWLWDHGHIQLDTPGGGYAAYMADYMTTDDPSQPNAFSCGLRVRKAARSVNLGHAYFAQEARRLAASGLPLSELTACITFPGNVMDRGQHKGEHFRYSLRGNALRAFIVAYVEEFRRRHGKDPQWTGFLLETYLVGVAYAEMEADPSYQDTLSDMRKREVRERAALWSYVFRPRQDVQVDDVKEEATWKLVERARRVAKDAAAGRWDWCGYPCTFRLSDDLLTVLFRVGHPDGTGTEFQLERRERDDMEAQLRVLAGQAHVIELNEKKARAANGDSSQVRRFLIPSDKALRELAGRIETYAFTLGVRRMDLEQCAERRATGWRALHPVRVTAASTPAAPYGACELAKTAGPRSFGPSATPQVACLSALATIAAEVSGDSDLPEGANDVAIDPLEGVGTGGDDGRFIPKWGAENGVRCLGLRGLIYETNRHGLLIYDRAVYDRPCSEQWVFVNMRRYRRYARGVGKVLHGWCTVAEARRWFDSWIMAAAHKARCQKQDAVLSVQWDGLSWKEEGRRRVARAETRLRAKLKRLFQLHPLFHGDRDVVFPELRGMEIPALQVDLAEPPPGEGRVDRKRRQLEEKHARQRGRRRRAPDAARRPAPRGLGKVARRVGAAP